MIQIWVSVNLKFEVSLLYNGVEILQEINNIHKLLIIQIVFINGAETHQEIKILILILINSLKLKINGEGIHQEINQKTN
jgi:hypothetical protein